MMALSSWNRPLGGSALADPWNRPRSSMLATPGFGGGGMSMSPFGTFADDMLADAMNEPGFGMSMMTPRGLMNQVDRQRFINLDVIEREDGYDISADLPDFDKNQINVDVSDTNLLTISAQREDKSEEGNRALGTWPYYHRMERSAKWARRSVQLPKEADGSNVNARFDDGVLHIDLPKKEGAETRTKRVTIA